MALAANALLSVEELKEYLSPSATKTDLDPSLEACINRVSSLIEDALNRKLVSQGSITEYHSIEAGGSNIWTSQYPIVSVTSVHESSAMTYDATTLLTETTNYIVSKPSGRLIRVSNSSPDIWLAGFRAVRIIYLAGYRSPAGAPSAAGGLPQRIVDAALKVAAKLWAEQERGLWGLSGQSDGAGNWTRFEAAALSNDILQNLLGDRRPSYGASTWEIDS